MQAQGRAGRVEPSPLTDTEIIEQVRNGRTELFEHLMRRHNARVYRAARAILHDDTEAEDVMQDAYVRAYEHLDEFEGRAQFSTWITRIAVNEALLRLRRSKRFSPLDTHTEEPSMSATPSSSSSPEQQASDVEMRAVLERAVGQLPEEFRAVFVLRAVEGMSGAETAECLGIGEETVKTRLHRARGRLQEMLLVSMEPVVPTIYDFHLSRCDRVVAGVLARILKP